MMFIESLVLATAQKRLTILMKLNSFLGDFKMKCLFENNSPATILTNYSRFYKYLRSRREIREELLLIDATKDHF